VSLEISEDSKNNGYRSTLKSSSLVGGSQALSYFIGFVRVKLTAFLLGPEGIGLMSLYTSLTGTITTVAGLGISESGVREIASVRSHAGEGSYDRTVAVLMRTSWLSGLIGLGLCISFAKTLSQYAFGNTSQSLPIALLGSTVLFSIIAGGRVAIIQGSGQYGKIAKINIISSFGGMLPVLLILVWWRERGIVPSLILGGALSLMITWGYSRYIMFNKCPLSAREFYLGVRPLLSLGIVFMLTGLIWVGKDMIVRTIITKSYGLSATGIYQSAWGISGLFVNFVLKAMGMDFYPRLTSMINNHTEMRRCVNQQMEIGMLLAFPGVIATITCAPFVLTLLYTSKFQSASSILAVMACGVFFKVISYPINTIQLAKGDAKGFGIIGMAMGLFEIALTIPMLLSFGLIGAASAYAISCFIHIIVMALVGNKMIDYRFNRDSQKLLLYCSLLMIVGLVAAICFSKITSLCIGVPLVILSSLICVRETIKRVGREHTIAKVIYHCKLGWIIA
jgi:PST family polysaccharide transporter